MPIKKKPTTRKTPGKRSNPSQMVPVVPLRGMVAFPSMVLPLFIGRDKSIAALQAASDGNKMLLLVAQRDESVEEPEADDLFNYGTIAEAVQLLKMPDGNVRVVVEGRQRVKIDNYAQADPFLSASVHVLREQSPPATAEAEALLRRLKASFEQVVNLSKRIPPEALQNAQQLDKLGPLTDLVVSFLE
ncbi:MAG TPA: LON peptidase substrate-binding domain-containing protein, partial [Abditibacteriaceae bacterium]|nr:LON peptidase substrate-binding domain-containing protein [Abditibacteriaceae bacterium]